MSITANAPTFTASPLGNYQIVSCQYQSTDTKALYPSLYREVRSYSNNKLLSKKRIKNFAKTATTNQITRTYNDYNGKKDGSTDGTYCQYRLVIYSDKSRKKVAKQSSLSSALYSSPAAPPNGNLTAAITTNTLTAKWTNPNMGSNASKQDALATVTLYDSDGVQVDTYTASAYTEVSYQFTGLTANTEYYFTVQYTISSVGSSRVARSKTFITTPLAPLQPTGITCGIVGGGRELPLTGTGSVYCTWQYNSADGSPQTGATGSTQAGSWSVADDTDYLTFAVINSGVIDPSYLTARVDGSGYDFTFTLSDVSSAGGTTAVGTTVTLFIPNTLTVTDNTSATATGLPLVFDVDTPFYDFVIMEVNLSVGGEQVATIPPTAVTHYAEAGSTRSYKVEMGADVYVPVNLTTYDYSIIVTTPYGTSAEVTGTITVSFAQPDAPTVTLAEADGYAVAATLDVVNTYARTITANYESGTTVDVVLPNDSVGQPVVSLACHGDSMGSEDISVTHDGTTYAMPSCVLFGDDVLTADSDGVRIERKHILFDSSDISNVSALSNIATVEWTAQNTIGIDSSSDKTMYVEKPNYQTANVVGMLARFYGLDDSFMTSFAPPVWVLNRRVINDGADYRITFQFAMTSALTSAQVRSKFSDVIVGVPIHENIDGTYPYYTEDLGTASIPATVADETFTFESAHGECPSRASVSYEDTLETGSAALYRITDGVRVMVSDGIANGGTAYDYTPPLNTEVEYVAVTMANGVPSVDSDPAYITINGGNALINYGDERQLLIEGTYDPAYSGSWSYDTVQIHYAGDEYPTGYDSGQRDLDSTLGFIAVEDADAIADMPDYGADVVYRDPEGTRFDAQVLSIADNYDSDKPGRRSVSVKLKRVEPDA